MAFSFKTIIYTEWLRFFSFRKPSSNDHWHGQEWKLINNYVSIEIEMENLLHLSLNRRKKNGASQDWCAFYYVFSSHIFSTRKLVELKPLNKCVMKIKKKKKWNKFVLAFGCWSGRQMETVSDKKVSIETWKRLLTWIIIICGGFSKWYLSLNPFISVKPCIYEPINYEWRVQLSRNSSIRIHKYKWNFTAEIAINVPSIH